MNWDAIGAVGEVIGAFAVVISLIYLAAQIKKQTEEARLAATRHAGDQFQNFMAKISDDGEFAEIWLNGVQDYDSLSNVERVRLSIFFNRALRILEQHHRHTDSRTIDPTYFASIDLTYAEFLRFPGVQQWWEGSKNQFEPQFRGMVDGMVRKSVAKGYESSFRNRATS